MSAIQVEPGINDRSLAAIPPFDDLQETCGGDLPSYLRC